MENTGGRSGSSSTATLNDKDCVKVAVNIQPLITSKLLVGFTDCITVAHGEPQGNSIFLELQKEKFSYAYTHCAFRKWLTKTLVALMLLLIPGLLDIIQRVLTESNTITRLAFRLASLPLLDV